MSEKMNVPEISVVLPVYNGFPYLKRSVESVLSQNFYNFEFLICDDFSTDESYQYLSSLRSSKITLFKNKKNLGLFPTLNFLIKQSKSNLIHLWAQDDIMLPTALSETIRFFNTYPNVSFMFSRLQNIDENNKILNYPKTYANRVISSEEHAIRSISFGCMPGNIANVVLNKKVVQKAGYFNEKMKYSGDFDLWCRLSKLAPVGESGKILTSVRSHNKQLSRNINASLNKLRENREVYNCLISVLSENQKTQALKILKWRHYPIFFSQFLSIVLSGNFKLAKKYYFYLIKYDNFFLMLFRWLVILFFRVINKEHSFYEKLRKTFLEKYKNNV